MFLYSFYVKTVLGPKQFKNVSRRYKKREISHSVKRKRKVPTSTNYKTFTAIQLCVKRAAHI